MVLCSVFFVMECLNNLYYNYITINNLSLLMISLLKHFCYKSCYLMSFSDLMTSQNITNIVQQNECCNVY